MSSYRDLSRPFDSLKVREGPTPEQRRVIVGFEHHTDLTWLRCLADGFRHCFCVVADGANWVLVDPLKTTLTILPALSLPEDELLHALQDDGRRLLIGTRTNNAGPHHRAQLRPLTCVEVVKRILGIDAPTVLTPWQLHRLLLRQYAFVELKRDVATHEAAIDMRPLLGLSSYSDEVRLMRERGSS